MCALVLMVPLCTAALSGCGGGDDDDGTELTTPPPSQTSGGQSCPADAPVEDTQVNSRLFPTLTMEVNAVWSGASHSSGGIDPLAFDTGPVTSSCPSDGGTDCFFTTGLTNCLHATSDFRISALTGLGQITFASIEAIDFDLKDVASHTQRGADAGKITDGVFAPEGTSFDHPSYAVVLVPGVGVGAALTIDLGSAMTICGNDATCGPRVQADRHPFQFDYSSDGVDWTPYSQVPAVSSSGLRTRGLAAIRSGQPNPDFTARYVRLYGLPADDDNYSISEVQLKNTAGQIISINTSATGSQPSQIVDGIVAPEGTAFDDTQYAVLLRSVGEANALIIDLGESIELCGTQTSGGVACGPVVQADRHPFQLDYSLDGVSWVPYSQVPAVGGSGLRTRGLQPIAAGSHNPNFTARYVRLYGLPSDDDNYSIAEVTLRDSDGTVVSEGATTYGPEPVALNGDVAPEGADWNDRRYASILSPCTTSSASTCPQHQNPPASRAGVTAGMLIDLTAVFPITAVEVQADRHEFQIDYSTDLQSWQPLWTVPAVSGSGLLSRPTEFFATPLPEARYLFIYGVAGDDENYSVSSVRVLTAVANTPCAFDSAATSGEDFACTYEGPLRTEIQVPSGGLPISFTIDSATGYLRCTNGTTDGSTPTKTVLTPGTTCTATLQTQGISSGSWCSGTCEAGAAVLAFTRLNADPVFTVSDLECDVTLDSDLHKGLVAIISSATDAAVTEQFNALVVTPIEQLKGPMIPSGTCR